MQAISIQRDTTKNTWYAAKCMGALGIDVRHGEPARRAEDVLKALKREYAGYQDPEMSTVVVWVNGQRTRNIGEAFELARRADRMFGEAA